jgi:nicotinamidase-related amidase
MLRLCLRISVQRLAEPSFADFYGAPLDLALHSRGITHLLVTGVTTDICVNCTVLSAANRNCRVTVVTDGVATIDDTLQERRDEFETRITDTLPWAWKKRTSVLANH